MIQFVDDLDLDLVEEAIEILTRIWNRASKNASESLAQYRVSLSACLNTLLSRHIRNDEGHQQEINASEMVIARALTFLVQVDPPAGKAALPRFVDLALAKENIFLQGAITGAIRALPEPLKLDLLEELVTGKTPRQYAKVSNFILG